MFTNPVVISVVVMTVLCLFRLNVILSLIVAALVGGLAAGMPIAETMGVLVGGMGGNAETAISYILLGALAAAIAKTGAADILALKITKVIKGKGIILLLVLAGVAALSGTIIPVHIAFIPILIPPLLLVMNKLKLDRRAAASALAFGLKAPYITLPIGYGLIYHNIIRDQMALSGMTITTGMVWRVTWIAGLAMVTGLIVALVVYRKPRVYQNVALNSASVKFESEEMSLGKVVGGSSTTGLVESDAKDIKITGKHYATLVAGVVALFIQLKFGSMPLGALAGLTIMLLARAIKWNDMEELMRGGIKLMGLIAFVMLVASGYASVMRATGGVESLVAATAGMMAGSKLIGATVMILLGLVITMGIGTSFGTVPILAAIYVPLASAIGFGVSATILLIAIAAALGDAGSPASDTTLGPTAGLNADGQHDHIWDTCVPTFLCYNIPLIIFGIIGAVILG